MSPSQELNGRVIEWVVNIMEAIRSPYILFIAFINSIADIFKGR